MLTIAELEELAQKEIHKTDRTKLIDIQDIAIDPTQSAKERMESYLEQIKNPYLFLCGDTTVRLRFNENGGELAGKLKSYYTKTKKG